jgi:hypothetical protein
MALPGAATSTYDPRLENDVTLRSCAVAATAMTLSYAAGYIVGLSTPWFPAATITSTPLASA